MARRSASRWPMSTCAPRCSPFARRSSTRLATCPLPRNSHGRCSERRPTKGGGRSASRRGTVLRQPRRHAAGGPNRQQRLRSTAAGGRRGPRERSALSTAPARSAPLVRREPSDRLAPPGEGRATPVAAIVHLLGHASVAATQVYLGMTPELLRAAALRFERYAASGNGGDHG